MELTTKIFLQRMKVVVIINGSGGVGKDTLIGFIEEQYNILNISSITPIKDAASILGWSGKDDKSRKFLADLKKLSTDYNDYPMKYLKDMYNRFLDSGYEIMFVAIREPANIQRFINEICPETCTLLIKRQSIKKAYGNSSDDNVERYSYDFVYENNCSLEDAKEDFIKFFQTNIISRYQS